MPIWMLDRIQLWNNAQSIWGPAISSTGMMLEMKDNQLVVTNLETMQVLVIINLFSQSTRCIVRGLSMAFQCMQTTQRFQLTFLTFPACQEVFYAIKDIIPCQVLNEITSTSTGSLQHPTSLAPSLGQLQGSFNPPSVPFSEVRTLPWQIPQAAADMTATMPESPPPEPPKSGRKPSTKKSQKQPLKPKPATSASSSTATSNYPLEISTGTQTSPPEDDSEIDVDTIQKIFSDPAFPSLISHIEEILQKLYPS